MESKSTILFTYLDFLFIGEVDRCVLDGVTIYDVQFALASNLQSREGIEIYYGAGPGNRRYWRQRFISVRSTMVDASLVEIIGDAIKVLEDI